LQKGFSASVGEKIFQTLPSTYPLKLLAE